MSADQKTAYIHFPGADYTQSAALKASRNILQPQGWKIIDGYDQPIPPAHQSLYLTDYDLLPFQDLLPCPSPSSSQCSSYVIRKALVRKHYLANSIHSYSVKANQPDLYTRCIPKTWAIEIQFSDELDELLLDDLYDLKTILQTNQAIIDQEKLGTVRWFILKPGMADRGNGIRLFSTVDQLQSIFEEFESDSQDEEENEEQSYAGKNTWVMTSQLRHFVAQEYLSDPLLVQTPSSFTLSIPAGPRKFHLRAYVLCCGSLSVYLHDDMLALFAPLPYSSPSKATMNDLCCHLTNTCLQQDGTIVTGDAGRPKEENVFLWSDLANAYTTSSPLSQEVISAVKTRSAQVIGLTFQAAAKAGSVHWQIWPNAFEIFGVDLLVDSQLDVKLLEINAQPDFAQTGARLSAVIDKLFERTCQIAVLRQQEEGWKVGESIDGTTLCFKDELSKAW